MSVGISPTAQRMRIAEAVLSCHQHLSAEEVYEKVNISGQHVSRATVYNALSLCVNRGLLRKILMNTDRVFYDSNVSDHHHFFDTETGELTDIEPEQLKILDLPVAPSGKKIVGVDLVNRLKALG